MIYLYNSLTNKIEEFKPIKENELSMYVCGPTVYNDIHIGNSRPLIIFDVVARFFKYLGYKVTYVSNFTDIDDKIIKKALESNMTEEEVSQKYIKLISSLYKQLNLLPHDANPLVTENMDSIINLIEKMVENGFAYVAEGDVYFDVSKAKDYGILSGQTVSNLESGARVEMNPKKKNPIDFTLWKKTEQGIKWDSPFGLGRPGWHTECVCMINNIFKGLIDLHGGGNDLKFPHHDNEIAQASCLFNHNIANYWMHNGRVDLANEKMSKSLGNVIWARDLIDEVGYIPYRLMMLNVPYRQLLNYTRDLLNQAVIEADKIKRTYISAYRYFELNNKEIDYEFNPLKDEFIEALSNDFNTPNAISVIYKVTKNINTFLRNKDEVKLYSNFILLKDMLWILGIDFEVNKLTDDEIGLINKWNDAKAKKDFGLADQLRKEIQDRKIQI